MMKCPNGLAELFAEIQEEYHHRLKKRLLFSIKIAKERVERLSSNRIPADWSARPPALSTKRIGDKWVQNKSSVALKAPSVLDPYGANILINPHHPDFENLEIGKGTRYPIDERLIHWED